MMTHTATPWTMRVVRMWPTQDTTDHYAICAGDETVAYAAREDENGQPDAEFIVRACNYHDELISLIERLVHESWTTRTLRDSANATLAQARGGT